jgi:hypothetical protein
MSIITFPTLVHQVDRAHAGDVQSSSAELHFTTFGTISPEMRLFLATEEVRRSVTRLQLPSDHQQISTVIQFRARDYGMEHCKLEFSLPKEYERMPGTGMEDAYNHPTSAPKTRSWTLSGDTKDLEIWTLDTMEWLNTSKLSYSTRPKRLARIGSMAARPGETMFSHSFTCPSDSIQSFEVFCVSPGCRVEVWQDTVKPIVGMSCY